MATMLSKKERGFVKDKIRGETGVQAVLNNYETEDYDTAASIASENLRKPKIVKAIADALPDDILAERHLELLNKREVHRIGQGENEEWELSDQPETQAVSKALDMAYKLKGSYAPEKSVSVNIEVPVGKQKTATNAIMRYLNGHPSNLKV